MHNASFLSQDHLQRLGFRALGRNVLIHRTVVLVGCDRIALGNDIRIDPFTILSAGQGIDIGAHVHIAAHCTLSGTEWIRLEDFVGISHGTKVLSSTDDFQGGFLTGPTIPEAYKNVFCAPVRFGRHAVVGANCVVLPGAELGIGTTVGALSLVKGVLKSWSVAGGVPAKEIGIRDRAGVLQTEAAFLAATEPSGSSA